MTGRFLIDTNIVIALFANDSTVQQHLSNAIEVFTPATVLGELYYGAYKSSRGKENVSRINEFASQNVVLSCDAATAQWYGQIKDGLRKKGRPIPENDIWIAAIALQYDLTLVTRDDHFQEIAGLQVEKWCA
ncbi:type II toxin-antitoxin system VapC family toxin [Desulforhabdus sp. TSK]|uniref:type II toxin-antitoxin system VapC family toxin n=1 Tax=Desulforhabdus sp. TSK TaxID=2925014 RepID=UPI001FC85297|nr:type II toxin-antitoxin system VapC family toxin [Desulforhabdus sp. TSK]GKT09318.1 ribonuclease VapC2 [Desulforhabdus sp. TSK]